MSRHHKKKKHRIVNNVNDIKEIKINVLCDDKLYEKLQENIGAKESVKIWDMPQTHDNFPFFPMIDIIGMPSLGLYTAMEKYNLLMLEENTIGVVISTASEMLANTMQKAKLRQALMVPILIVDEAEQAGAAETPTLILEKSRFDSEKELYDFLGRIIDSLLCVDTFDLGLLLNESGRLFFTYAAGEDLEIIADKLRDSLKNHDDICAKGSVVLAVYNIANADSFDAENFTSWTKGLHKLFGASCNFIDDVRENSSENSSVSMWIKI